MITKQTLVTLSVGKVADTPLLCILNTLLGPNGPKHVQFYLSSADGTEKFELQHRIFLKRFATKSKGLLISMVQ